MGSIGQRCKCAVVAAPNALGAFLCPSSNFLRITDRKQQLQAQKKNVTHVRTADLACCGCHGAAPAPPLNVFPAVFSTSDQTSS